VVWTKCTQGRDRSPGCCHMSAPLNLTNRSPSASSPHAARLVRTGLDLLGSGPSPLCPIARARSSTHSDWTRLTRDQTLHRQGSIPIQRVSETKICDWARPLRGDRTHPEFDLIQQPRLRATSTRPDSGTVPALGLVLLLH
jgi:hypothetical protein